MIRVSPAHAEGEPTLEIKTVINVMPVSDKVINFMITNRAVESRKEEYIKVIESFKLKQL